MKAACWLLLPIVFASWQACAHTHPDRCHDELPGEVGIPFDSPDRVKLTLVDLAGSEQNSYIATQYIGAANLRAEIYTEKNVGYCLVADAGPFIGYSIDKTESHDGYYDVTIESVSGSSRFFRTYRYKRAAYEPLKCKIRLREGSVRPCGDNEK